MYQQTCCLFHPVVSTCCVFSLYPLQGLTSCKDTVIGNSLTKGISGGQMKRTNIGIALIADPRVLMLDEPTSGLDSFSANEVSG
jgi:ABC-type multidrug transport system ATPase subunit